jgi:hypothetical protein
VALAAKIGQHIIIHLCAIKCNTRASAFYLFYQYLVKYTLSAKDEQSYQSM